jgi:predicted Ser/Thr protein kinase
VNDKRDFLSFSQRIQEIYLISPNFSSRAYHQREARTLSYLTISRFRRIIEKKVKKFSFALSLLLSLQTDDDA